MYNKEIMKEIERIEIRADFDYEYEIYYGDDFDFEYERACREQELRDEIAEIDLWWDELLESIAF